MKIKISQLREQANERYMNYVVDEFSKAPKRAVSAEQSESTKRLLSMDKAELELYRERPIDIAKATALHPDFSTRPISGAEKLAHKRMQRAEKNTIGQSELPSYSQERKEKATIAFVNETPAELSYKQLKAHTKKEYPNHPEYEKIKESWFAKFKRKAIKMLGTADSDYAYRRGSPESIRIINNLLGLKDKNGK